jgi:hypothetical protein
LANISRSAGKGEERESAQRRRVGGDERESARRRRVGGDERERGRRVGGDERESARRVGGDERETGRHVGGERPRAAHRSLLVRRGEDGEGRVGEGEGPAPRMLRGEQGTEVKESAARGRPEKELAHRDASAHFRTGAQVLL